jgi:hypothetical protein
MQFIEQGPALTVPMMRAHAGVAEPSPDFVGNRLQVRDRLLTVPGVEEADVQIVWDPPWNQSMITEAGKKRLGIW